MLTYNEALQLAKETTDSKELINYIYSSIKKDLEEKAKQAPSFSERCAYVSVIKGLYPEYKTTKSF